MIIKKLLILLGDISRIPKDNINDTFYIHGRYFFKQEVNLNYTISHCIITGGIQYFSRGAYDFIF